MAHPHKGEALASSREKMRRFGHGGGGGGTPFGGASPFKRPAGDGEQHSYHAHSKQFSADGGKGKRRHGFKRGGAVKKAGGGPTGTGKFPEKREPSIGDMQRLGDEGVMDPKFGPTHTAAPMVGYDTPGAPPGDAPLTYGTELQDVNPDKEKSGGTTHVHKHFHVHKRKDGGRTNQPSSREVERHNAKLLGKPPTVTYQGAGSNVDKAARHARGGRTKGKHTGPIIINVGQPHRAPPGLGGVGAALPQTPPPNPPGGAAPPMPPPAPPMGGPPPGGGGAPGVNPMAAQQALSQIAGGGGPLGAGMPGRGPFAKGGKVSSPGLAKHMDHWRNYAKRNVRHNMAHEHGATGESGELPLKTPIGKARGGAAYPIDAGQATGVAREEQYNHRKRGR
jgi:hypothetical protein